MNTDRPGPGSSRAVFTLSVEDQLTLHRLFVETCHQDLQLLTLALQDAEFDQVLHRVHRLHGAALTVGAAALVAIVAVFEQALRASGQIPADHPRHLAHLRQALEQYQQR